MLLTAVVCVGLAWLQPRLRQQRLGRELRERGAAITYAHEYGDADVRDLSRETSPPGPEWVRKLLGDDIFADIVDIALLENAGDWKKGDLSPLLDAPKLRWLSLSSPDFTDVCLPTLAQLKCLERLDLGRSNVTDEVFSLLPDLPRLKRIFLDGREYYREFGKNHLMYRVFRRADSNDAPAPHDDAELRAWLQADINELGRLLKIFTRHAKLHVLRLDYLGGHSPIDLVADTLAPYADQIDVLILEGVHVDGRTRDRISKLPPVRWLALQEPRLTSVPIPFPYFSTEVCRLLKDVAELDELISIDAYQTMDWSGIRQMTQLRAFTLGVEYGRSTRSTFDFRLLEGLPKLETLRLAGTSFDDDHLAQLKGLTQLRRVELDSSWRDHGEAVETIRRLLPQATVVVEPADN